MRVTTLISLAVACQATCMRSCGRVGCARQPTYYPRSTASEGRQSPVQFGGAMIPNGGQPVVFGGAINPPMPTGGAWWPYPQPQFPYPQPQFPYPQPGQGWYPQPQFPYPQSGWPYPQPQYPYYPQYPYPQPYPPQPQWPYPQPPQPCTQACSCDNGCSLYGDCCFDYISYCVNPQAPTMAPTTMAPTTMEPTAAPTRRPTLATDAPTRRPTLATDAPTGRPTLATSAPTSSAPTNQPTRPTAPPVTGAWQTVPMGSSCDGGCAASGKICNSREASANIDQVSTGPKVNTILVAGGVDTTGSTNFPSGSLPSVPYYDTAGKVIHFSDIPRDPNSIQCGLIPAPTDIRVCYCA